MSGKEVIIIGAGMAGLAAGCYLQMNGYRTRIFEMHSLPGGICTAWKRKGYTFDGCIHCLVGSNPENNFHAIWRELHAVQDREFVYFDEFSTMEYGDGKIIHIHTDLDKLESELLAIGPEDAKEIRALMRDIKAFSAVELPVGKARELWNVLDYLKVIFTKPVLIKTMFKWRKVSVNDFARRLKNVHLREILPRIFGFGDIAVWAVIISLAAYANRSGGYPIGGSLAFARAVEKRYIALGGTVVYGQRVRKVLHQKGRACGVRLESGVEEKADIVISAADGYDTVFNMLDGKYLNGRLASYFKTLPLFTPTLQLSLGIAREMKDLPFMFSFPFSPSIKTSDVYEIKKMAVRVYHMDPLLAPEGKTYINTIVPTNYEYWENLKLHDPQRYTSEKNRIANELIDIIDAKLGDIKPHIEVMDIASPVTYVRYTNNWKGSWEGWFPSPRSMGAKFKKTLPGLKDFYLTGQWVAPGGGLPQVVMSARDLVQVLCRKDRREFQAFA